jgi:hypothetical protein
MLDHGTGQRVNVDGIDARDALVRLVDDRRDHRVAVTIPRSRDVNRGEA